MTTTTTRTRTARKVVGSLGVIGAAAAVAGLGTYGAFTDSTTPVATSVDSGTVSVNLNQPAAGIPVSVSDFLPGDSMTRAVDLVNDGTSALSSIILASTATTSSVLDTDPLNGLQLTLQSCPVAWTEGGTADAPTYTCSSTAGATTLGSGPVATNMSLSSSPALTAGGTQHLVFAIALPTSADNTFQGKSSTLSLVFSGMQRAGTAR